MGDVAAPPGGDFVDVGSDRWAVKGEGGSGGEEAGEAEDGDEDNDVFHFGF